MGTKIGKQTIKYENSVYIKTYYSSVGKLEGEGPLGQEFDVIYDDEYVEAKSWEQAENNMLKHTVTGAFAKAELSFEDIDYAFSGDLLNQCTASSFALKDMGIPYFGLYGACSTMAESMSLGSVMVDAGYGSNVLAVTSSHFCSSEKQYRFPLEYGAVRTPSAQWTVTGSGAVILSPSESGIRIDGITTGVMVDMGVKDSANMGAAMAPAAADCILAHLRDLNLKPTDYDCIVTGDLGFIGTKLVRELTLREGVDISEVHMDCGNMIFDPTYQNTGAGGSGCGCSASVFCGHFCPQIESGKIRKMLLVCTGALMSPTTYQLGETVVGIAHAVALSGGKAK